jgi:hypothetical protein
MTFRDNIQNITLQRKAEALKLQKTNDTAQILPLSLRPIVLLSAAVSSEMAMTSRQTYLARRLDRPCKTRQSQSKHSA